MITKQKESLTVRELEVYAKEFLERVYNLELDIPIEINGRLTRSLGRFCTRKGKAHKIDLAKLLLTYGADRVVLDVLTHELIHYALYSTGKPYRDGQKYFENELKKHGSHSTNTLKVGKYFILKCKKCEDILYSKKSKVKDNLTGFHSMCCKADLEYMGEEIKDETE